VTIATCQVLALRAQTVFPSATSLVRVALVASGVFGLRKRWIAVLSLGVVVLGGACSKPVPTRVFAEQVTRDTTPTRATLKGIVHDIGGKPHPGARLALEGLGEHYTATADATGAYILNDITPGTYVLTVDCDDMTGATTNGVQIGATTRSSRKEVTLRAGINTIDAESGF